MTKMAFFVDIPAVHGDGLSAGKCECAASVGGWPFPLGKGKPSGTGVRKSKTFSEIGGKFI
jgi:hypothetical protein